MALRSQALSRAWYVQRLYTLVPNPDKSLRIRYWDCSENPNNDVTRTQEGATDYKGFTFTDKSNKTNPITREGTPMISALHARTYL